MIKRVGSCSRGHPTPPNDGGPGHAPAVHPLATFQPGHPGASHHGRLDGSHRPQEAPYCKLPSNARPTRHGRAPTIAITRLGPPVIDLPAGSPGCEPSGQIGRLVSAPSSPCGKPPRDGQPGGSLRPRAAQEGGYSTILYRSNLCFKVAPCTSYSEFSYISLSY